ncbi:MAG: hypothetical protein N2378_10085 [Chloroflexaceae bacterium]|nr:hypothetical protein [Chloroflexaceae bacterium]
MVDSVYLIPTLYDKSDQHAPEQGPFVRQDAWLTERPGVIYVCRLAT